MSITKEMIDAMIDADLTREQMATLMKASIAQEEAKQTERRAKDAERQRKSRANREQSRNVTVTTRDNADVTDASSSPLDGPLPSPAPQPSPLYPPTTSTIEEGAGEIVPFPKAKSRKADRAAKLTTLPADFTLTAARISFALREGLTDEAAHREFSKFTASAEAHGRKYVNWDRAWENWVRTSVDGFGRSSRPAAGGHGSSSGGRFGAMQRALAKVANSDVLPE